MAQESDATEHDWLVIGDDAGACHVIPKNDLRGHKPSEYCWCRPYDEDGVRVHNSLDGREFYERRERSLS